MTSSHIENPIGLRGVAAVLPPRTCDMDELKRDGLLVSEISTLRELGFEKVHICAGRHDVEWLALESARRAMDQAAIDSSEIDVLIWAGALAETHVKPCEDAERSSQNRLLSLFHYPASWLQEELHLNEARVTAVAQQGCAGMFSALSMGHALLASDTSVRNVLCVGVDALPDGSAREVLYNLISDAGCAAVLSRDRVTCRWRAFHQVSKGYYWNVVEKQKEIIASYFPTSRAVIRELLEKEGMAAGDIHWILPTGVSRGSWEILAGLTALDTDRIYRGSENFGHTIAADNLLHLEALLASDQARSGEALLLFTFGFGSTWCGLILEKT